MNKAFTRESDDTDDDAPEGAPLLPSGTKNYMTPGGFAALKGELDLLVGKERPELVATIAWAAGNGDRSENGDYIYGKKRLREVDRRLRFLIKRLDSAEVGDPTGRAGAPPPHAAAAEAGNRDREGFRRLNQCPAQRPWRRLPCDRTGLRFEQPDRFATSYSDSDSTEVTYAPATW